MRRNTYRVVLAVCGVFSQVSQGLAQHCSANWTPEYKCLEGCGPCPQVVGNQYRQQQYQLEIQRQQDLRRQQEEAEAERRAKANEADQRGLDAASRGRWQLAAKWFVEALRLAPDSPEIRAHLDRANVELADMESAAEIVALRERIEDSIAAARIEALRLRLENVRAVQRFTAMLARFRPPRQYKLAGNGLVGGTGWRLFASRKQGEPAKRMCEVIKQQSNLAGSPFDAGVDCERYQFVLGIADAFNVFTDLRDRVVFDDLTNGQFSAHAQRFYEALRGKQFDELGCHSNGAMLCLAALENEDVKADHIVLYGPQVTRETLHMWDQLVRDGRVKSVKVYINENDPVPALAICYADHKNHDENLGKGSLFDVDSLKRTINETSPELLVQTFPCSRSKLSFDCHAMAMYKSKVKSRR
jgi:hypothetical protein